MLDDQGRLFGRLNLVDAAVAFFLLGLVPLGYATWVLFRQPLPPRPVIKEVTPAVVEPGKEGQYLLIRGQHLRPYLHARVADRAAVFLFETPDHAQIQLTPLEPGTYDLTLFDTAGEVARAPGAVTVRPDAKPTSERLVETRVLVRFVTRPEVVEAVKRAQRRPVAPEPQAGPPAPVLLSFEVTDELRGTTKDELREGTISIVRGLVRVMAVRTATGWQFGGRPLKAGAPFTLEAETYLLSGVILSIDLVGPSSSSPHDHP